METRVQVAYHFKVDPAKLIPGAVRLPETITRTVAVGDEMKTEKISSSVLSPTDRAALIAEIEKQTAEANRVARPADEIPEAAQTSAVAAASETEEGMNAF